MDKTEHFPAAGVALLAGAADCICGWHDIGSCRGCSNTLLGCTAGRQVWPSGPGMPTTIVDEQPVNGLTSRPVLHTGTCSFGIAKSVVNVHDCHAMYLQVCLHMLLTPKSVARPRPLLGGLGQNDHICPGLYATAKIPGAQTRPRSGCMPLGHRDSPWLG